MKNIYKITKGQLISLWVFGVIGWLYTLDSYSDLSGFLSIFIPAILVFYTIGWRYQNKKSGIETESKDFKAKISEINFKKLVKPFIALLLIIIIGFGISKLSETRKEKERVEKLKQDYGQAILKVDSLEEQLRSCLKPIYEKKYQEELRSCNLLLNKTKSDYRTCLGYADRDWCIYTYDYESVDCSDKTIKSKLSLNSFLYGTDMSCSAIYSELSDVNKIIDEYKKLND